MEILEQAEFWDGTSFAVVIQLDSGKWIGAIEQQATPEGILVRKHYEEFVTYDEAVAFARKSWLQWKMMKNKANGGPRPTR